MNGDEYERGKFSYNTLKDYAAARRIAYVSLALMPPRVPFEVAENQHDKYAEAARDHEFFQRATLRVFQNRSNARPQRGRLPNVVLSGWVPPKARKS